ncbi:MAG TPA: POTRA domain-containing protein [Candidatus Dormibacteraeota bacterium]|nr:POTRA domain-containing protein [Candidatus Dormibacteraeota bacterium]
MKTFRRRIGTLFVVAVAAGLTSLAPKLHSQQIEATSAAVSYEGQRVSSVQLAGQPDGNPRKLRALIAQPVNAPYAQAKVDETVAALKTVGDFKDVEVQVTPAAEGVHVVFVLKPAYYFGVYTFPKAEKTFSYTRLLQAANYSKQEPFTQEKVEEAESSLLEFFHRTGFFLATVEPKMQTDQAHGVVNVEYDINLKKRAKFGDVILAGVSEEQTKRLNASLRSIRARIKGAYIKPGKPYSLKKLTAATAFLQQQLGKQHFLAGRVKLVSTLYNAETNRTDIKYDVTEGPKIEIKLAGAHVWGRTQKKLIPMYQENAVDPDLVNEGAQDLTSYFQAKGYFGAKVQSQIQKQPSGVTVLYQIVKGPRGKVDAVEFHGNEHFSDKDLKSHVLVTRHVPMMPFSHGKYSEQLVRKSVKNIEGLYRGAGYSQVKVTPKVVNKDNELQLAFQVEEGVRDVVESLQLEGNKALTQQELAPKGMNLEPGKPYSTQLLTKDRDQIMATYLDKGFLNVTFKSKVEHTKDDPHHVHVVYEVEEGPQVHTASVESIGAQHTRPEIVARNANIKVDKPLSETALLRGESQLYTLGVFDWASVDTRQPITDDPKAEVLVKLHESKRNSIAYGFGFQVINRGGSIPSGTIALPGLPPIGLPTKFATSQQTFWGPEGSIEYTRRNFRSRAETLTLSAFGGRLDQRAAASLANPTIWNTGWSSTVTFSAERTSENPIFTARLGGAGIQFQHYLDKNRQKSVIFRYDFRRTNLSNITIPDLVRPEDQNVRLSSLSASFSRDSRDNPLDAHKGIYESFQVDMNPGFMGSSTSFGRFLGQTAYYKSLTSDSSLVWANSLRLGMEHAFGGSHIPISESFFSGGGSTLRGFSLNGAGPQREVLVCPTENPNCGEKISVPVGGKQLVILNSELRFPLGISAPLIGGTLGGVVFYDAGNVYSNVSFKNVASDLTHTVGFGARYKTPVGPVRIDIGHLLNAPPGVKTLQFFVTLGQAF